ncbi:hypothetical protein T03_1310 [Trichinella britovi]|uniref:MULE transposase domain-containing protein n=1 Tax=Trichinella britovi TaxID=45882 RepID=A0A0V1CLW8_TRIBR|nr:hypothetical protein T03_1310 [Trichinella britovi]
MLGMFKMNRNIYWYLPRVSTLDCWQPCEPGGWMVFSRLYHSGINNAFVEGKLVPAVCCLCTGKDIGTYWFIFQALINKAAVLRVNLNPETIICDFEIAL